MLVLVGIGLVTAVTVVWSQLSRRRQSTQLGCMSEQWLAEHRADHSN